MDPPDLVMDSQYDGNDVSVAAYNSAGSIVVLARSFNEVLDQATLCRNANG